MPHSWSRLSDTHFELLHFTKHRHGKGERKRELGEAGANKHQGKQHGGKMAGKEHIGKDHSNPVASAVGKLAEVQSTQRPPLLPSPFNTLPIPRVLGQLAACCAEGLFLMHSLECILEVLFACLASDATAC